MAFCMAWEKGQTRSECCILKSRNASCLWLLQKSSFYNHVDAALGFLLGFATCLQLVLRRVVSSHCAYFFAYPLPFTSTETLISYGRTICVGSMWHRGDSQVLCCYMQWHRCGGFLTLMPLNWKNFFSSACGCVGSVYVKSYCNNHFVSQLKDRIRKLLEGWVIGDTGNQTFSVGLQFFSLKTQPVSVLLDQIDVQDIFTVVQKKQFSGEKSFDPFLSSSHF